MTHLAPRASFLPTRSRLPLGHYGWLYRNLEPWRPGDGDDLEALAEWLTDRGLPGRENPSLPAAYTYFGQFVDHDLTFDPSTLQQRRDDPNSLYNFRSPAFDLDCLYGRGPDDQPYLYSGRDRFELLTGGSGDLDLPRNLEGTALTGDPRNDENVLVSQLHMVFILFHNSVLRYVRQEEELTGRRAFERARTLVRWHYQWVAIHDYLARILDPVVFESLRAFLGAERAWSAQHLRHFRPTSAPYIPVEFSAAVYRFGHGMIRGSYALNPTLDEERDRQPIPIFDPDTGEDLRGGGFLRDGWQVNWSLFLDTAARTPQRAMRIEPRLDARLRRVPMPDGSEVSLAYLDLMRGVKLGLPSGQALARAMGLVDVLTPRDVGLESCLADETPLWLYVLREAELQQDGLRLGRLGSEVVGEVFVGLLRLDPYSYLSVDPGWRPVFAHDDRFELKDLMKFANRPA